MISDSGNKTAPTYDYPGQSDPGYKFKKPKPKADPMPKVAKVGRQSNPRGGRK